MADYTFNPNPTIGADDWSNSAAWGLPEGQLPGPGDDVFFAGGSYAVQIDGSFSVGNVTLNSPDVTFVEDPESTTGNELNINGTLDINAGAVGGAVTILNATITDNGTPFFDNTFYNVTWLGVLQVGTPGDGPAFLSFRDSLTLGNAAGNGPGQINIDGSGSYLELVGSLDIDDVTIDFGSAQSSDDTIADEETLNSTLTFGPNVTIDQTGLNDAIEMEVFEASPTTNAATFDFQGVLNATDGSFSIYSNPAQPQAQFNSFLNQGEIDVSGTASVDLQASLIVNDVSALIDAVDGSELDITDTTELDNKGELDIDDSSTFNLTVGSLDNTGLIELGSTLGGSFTVDAFSNEGTIAADANFQGTIDADAPPPDFEEFQFNGTNAFTNAATGLIDVTADGTLEFAQNAFDNQGTIIVDGSNFGAPCLLLAPAASTENDSTIVVTARGTLVVTSGTFSNTTFGRVFVDSGAVFFLDATDWTNTGGMTVTGGGTLSLGGSFTANAASAIEISDGGTLAITGVMDNDGNTFSVDGLTGSGGGTFVLDGGEIDGGTVVASETTLQSFGGLLDGVTFDGPIVLSQDDSSLTLLDACVVEDGTQPGTIAVTGEGAILELANDYSADDDDDDLDAARQVLNAVTITLGSDNPFAPAALEQTDEDDQAAGLVLGSETTIDVVGAGDITGLLVQNDGTIDSTQGGLLIASLDFLNTGVIASSNQAPLGVQFGNDFTNVGTISFDLASGAVPAYLAPGDQFDNQADGTIEVAAGVVQVAPGTTFTNEGTLAIGSAGTFEVLENADSGNGFSNDGLLDDAGNTAISSFGFDNQANGTVAVAANASLQISAASWGNAGTITVGADGNLVLGGEFGAADAANITDIGGNVTITGELYTDSGSIAFAGGLGLQTVHLGGGFIGPQSDGPDGTLVVGAQGAVLGYGTLAGEVTDNGLIQAIGGSLSLPDGLDGTGVIQVAAGGTLDIGDDSNIGTLDVQSGGTAFVTSNTLSTDPLLVESSGVLAATGTITGSVTNNGEISGNVLDELTLTGSVSGSGTLVVGTDGSLDLAAGVSAGQVLSFDAPNAALGVDDSGGGSDGVIESATVGQPVAFNGTLVNFAAGDGIFLAGLTADLATWSPGSLALTDHGTPVGSLAISGDYRNAGFLAQPEADGTELSIALCFLAGTRIRTPDGDVPVAQLAVGDSVVTWSGTVRPIVWIGHGRVLATRGRRNAATPVIVRKGAIADNVPACDLRVTKGHALFLDDVLMPVEYLVNHRSIVWDDHAQEVSLFHLELDRHDVLIANGAPAESYRDDGNRWLFQNANSGWGLPPQTPCAPVLTGGPVVDAAWRRLLDRAGARPGLPLTGEPDLHLLVDGKPVEGWRGAHGSHVFVLPRPSRDVRVVSRTGSPAELGLARDPRVLGVAVRQIRVWQGRRLRVLDAADASLAEGFHAFEPDHGFRWTNGDAALPASLFADIPGVCRLELLTAGDMQYPLFAEHAPRAAAWA